jgi:DeoR/GlpR family transcriptional regulator of sugar metabolism
MTTNDKGGKTLLAQERRKRILELIQEEGSARVTELFEVSEPTIRQDLEVLDQQGFVTREHGGAFLHTASRQVRELTLQHMSTWTRNRSSQRRPQSS